MKVGFSSVLLLLAACAHDAEKPMPKAEPTVSAAPSSESPPSSEISIANDEPVMLTGDAGASSSAPATAPSEACTNAADGYRLKIKDAVNACYREGKAKNPFLSGRFKVTVAVDAQGKGGGHRVEAGSALGTAVVDCMLKASKAVPFQDAACKGKSITVLRVYGSDTP